MDDSGDSSGWKVIRSQKIVKILNNIKSCLENLQKSLV